MRDQTLLRRVRWALWLAWALALLACYYRELWRLLLAGPAAWVGLLRQSASLREGLFAIGLAIGSLVLILALMAASRRLRPRVSLSRRRRWLWGALTGAAVTMGLAILYAAPPRLAFLSSGLPAFAQARDRALAGLLGAGVTLLAAHLLGRLACAAMRWQPEDWREALLFRTTVGLTALSYLSLAVSLLGLYRPAAIRTMIAIVLLGGALWWARKMVARLPRNPDEPQTPGIRGKWTPRAVLWPGISAIAVLVALVGALAPEIEYDALWYHLWLPKLWLQAGRPVDVVHEYISLYPLAWELLYGNGLAWGNQISAKLLHFICLPLTALLVYQMTRRFLPGSPAWVGVAAFLTIPTVLWEASTAYIDLALTLYVGLAIYALLRYAESRSRAWFALAVLTLGSALAIKHLAWFVLLLASAGLALRLWLEERDLQRAVVPALVLALTSLLLSLPWYLRSWLASGNPIFPDFFSVFGARPAERWDALTEQAYRRFEARFGRPRTLPNLLTLPWDVTVHAARYYGVLGPLFLLALPAPAGALRAQRNALWLLAFVVLFVALWASGMGGMELRFLMPITPFLAALVAVVYGRLDVAVQHRRPAWTRWILPAGLACLLVLNFPPFIPLHELDRVEWDGWLTHVTRRIPFSVVLGRESEEEYLKRSVLSYGAWNYINRHLPADARVLAFSGGDQFYSERDRLWSDATLSRPATWGASQGQEEQARQALFDLGISHVLFDKAQWAVLRSAQLAITEPAVIDEWYEVEYEDPFYILYRIRWETMEDDGKRSRDTIPRTR
jgi:hypothetical protein